jgi:replicative DNA helicase
MGKTAIAMNIAEHVALELEASGARLLDGNGGRSWRRGCSASLAKVDSHALRTGAWNPADWDRMGTRSAS